MRTSEVKRRRVWRAPIIVPLLALAGCAQSAQSSPECNPPCRSPLVCDYVARRCVAPQQDAAPGGCPRGMLSCRGKCVNASDDPTNCGQCGIACGNNAECAGGSCRCLGTFSNCNKFWADGCECGGACSGNDCAAAPTGCDPAQAGSCGQQEYCDRTAKQCIACPLGSENCDRVGGCECKDECIDGRCAAAGNCDQTIKGHCGGTDTFCDAASGQCAACPGGKLNCDLLGECECEGTCDGARCSTPQPACSWAVIGDCGDQTSYCDASDSCQTCPQGTLNCDRMGDCECDSTCSGDTCAASCGYYDSDVCGKDQDLWCYNGACDTCPAGYFNCDHTRGCECQGGCNGTACASGCDASCVGCCDEDTCIAHAAQSPYSCGNSGDACAVCPLGTYCEGGQCLDCSTSCPGCCTPDGDCLLPNAQPDTDCGKGGAACADCTPGSCSMGVCGS